MNKKIIKEFNSLIKRSSTLKNEPGRTDIRRFRENVVSFQVFKSDEIEYETIGFAQTQIMSKRR